MPAITSIIAAIVAATTLGGTIASAASGDGEPDKPKRSPEATSLFRDTVQSLSELKPPDLLANKPSPFQLDPDDTIGQGLKAPLLSGQPEGPEDPNVLFGNLGSGLVQPRGGFLERANALQTKLNTSTIPIGSVGSSLPPIDFRKKQLGY